MLHVAHDFHYMPVDSGTRRVIEIAHELGLISALAKSDLFDLLEDENTFYAEIVYELNSYLEFRGCTVEFFNDGDSVAIGDFDAVEEVTSFE